MLYSCETDTIYSKCKQNLSFQLWEKAHNELSRERGENLTLVHSQIFLELQAL